MYPTTAIKAKTPAKIAANSPWSTGTPFLLLCSCSPWISDWRRVEFNLKSSVLDTSFSMGSASASGSWIFDDVEYFVLSGDCVISPLRVLWETSTSSGCVTWIFKSTTSVSIFEDELDRLESFFRIVELLIILYLDVLDGNSLGATVSMSMIL